MSPTWPDQHDALVNRYVQQLPLRSARAPRVYRCILRRFQRFVLQHSPAAPLSQETIAAWLRDRAAAWPRPMVLHRARVVDRFLDWLVANGFLSANPLAELRQTYRQWATAPIVRALLEPDPTAALAALRPVPRFASHLGPLIEAYLSHMRALGFRYGHEGEFLRFDRFLQTRTEAAQQPLARLVRAWADAAGTPAGKVRRLRIGRAIAQAMQRAQGRSETVSIDRLLLQEARRQQRRPYIYTVAEVQRLLAAARHFPSPKAPLRPVTLYTMLILAYCAGLRLGEVVRLTMGDANLDEGWIEIRETKFFKSRRLPLTVSVVAALRDYLAARQRAGAPADPQTPLFWQETDRSGYRRATVGALLVTVLRQAGLKPATGRTGPRLHDLRHAFVVHRMLAWYREGINPQSRLPYLATYLGHRDINATLVYLTITQDLLQNANERFRAWGAKVLDVSPEGGTL